MNGFLIAVLSADADPNGLGLSALGENVLFGIMSDRRHRSSRIGCFELVRNELPWRLVGRDKDLAFLCGQFDPGGGGSLKSCDSRRLWDTYRNQGIRSVALANGEFCAAFIDFESNLVVATANLFAHRAVFFLAIDGVFVVSSSSAAILAMFDTSLVYNVDAILSALVPFARPCFEDGQTFYEKLRILRAGERVELDLGDGSFRVFEESIPDTLVNNDRSTLRSLQIDFATAFEAAVNDRIIGSRYNLSLSGGLDSSGLAVVLSDARQRFKDLDLQAINVSLGALMDDDDFSYARGTAGRLGLSFGCHSRERELFSFPCAASVPWSDSPMSLYGDLGVIRAFSGRQCPTFFGTGADEVFLAGYLRPGLSPSRFTRGARRLWDVYRRFGRLWRGRSLDAQGGDFERLMCATVPEWLIGEGRAAWSQRGGWFEARESGDRQWFSCLRTASLPLDVESVDALGLTSLEPLMPFFDHRVISVCTGVAAGTFEHRRLGDAYRKRLLRRYLVGRVPMSVVFRRKTPAGVFALDIGARSMYAVPSVQELQDSPMSQFVDVSRLPDVEVDRPWSTVYPRLAVCALSSWFHHQRGIRKWISL